MLEDTENGTGEFSVKEIAEKLPNDNDISNKALATWIGKTIRQFSLYDKQGGRKDKSRSYYFTIEKVKDIYQRYHQVVGFSGQVVRDQENQAVTDSHLKKTGGTKHPIGSNGITTEPYEPPIKNEVEQPKVLINKNENHLTTETTSQAEDKTIEVLEVIE